MSILIILGNTNIFTFTNAITIASQRARVDLGEPLHKIFVIHTNDSQSALQANEAWKDHLQRQGIKAGIVETVIELDAANKKVKNKNLMDKKVREFVDFVALAIRSTVDSSKVIVDLTNGTVQYKNLLSTAAYVLDIQHQYLFDTVQLRILTKGENKFFSANKLSKYYVSAPRSSQLDNIAYLNLTEVVRHKKVVSMLAQEFGNASNGSGDIPFFYDNSLHSIKFKLEGDERKDNSLYRISASSMSASLEEVVSSLHACLPSGTKTKQPYLTLGQQLGDITRCIETKGNLPNDFDMKFYKKFCEFVLYLRNSTTHKGKVLTVAQKYKSELAMKTAFPFIEYCIKELWPIVVGTGQSGSSLVYHEMSDPASTEQFYFGVDGDNTGVILEQLFRAEGSHDDLFRRMSEVVASAIDTIVQTITSQSKEALIIFAAGDDILFKSHYNSQLLQKIQEQYKAITSTLTSDLESLGVPNPTCSIGYGRSLREVYLALKLAKSKLGKNSIVGIEAV